MISSLEEGGIIVLCKSRIHQKFSIVVYQIVWYGSINLLSFGSSDERIIRLTSPHIVHELTGTIDSQA